jgi:hypothetical protein
MSGDRLALLVDAYRALGAASVVITNVGDHLMINVSCGSDDEARNVATEAGATEPRYWSDGEKRWLHSDRSTEGLNLYITGPMRSANNGG